MKVLIITGGGSKVVCIAGFVYRKWQSREFNPHDYDVIIAGSAGAPVACMIAANQISDLYRFWDERVSLIQTVAFPFVGRYTPNCFLDIMQDGGLYNLDLKKLEKSPCEVIVPLMKISSHQKGGLEYISLKNNMSKFWDILRATASVPVISDEYPKINGNRYCDSIEVSHANAHIRYVLEKYPQAEITILNCLGGDGISYSKKALTIRNFEKRLLRHTLQPVFKISEIKNPQNITIFNLRPIKGTKFWNVRNVKSNLRLYTVD